MFRGVGPGGPLYSDVQYIMNDGNMLTPFPYKKTNKHEGKHELPTTSLAGGRNLYWYETERNVWKTTSYFPFQTSEKLSPKFDQKFQPISVQQNINEVNFPTCRGRGGAGAENHVRGSVGNVKV